MFVPVIRCRISQLITKTSNNKELCFYRRLFCSKSPKEPPLSSTSHVNNSSISTTGAANSTAQTSTTSSSTHPPPEESVIAGSRKKGAWGRILIYGLVGAFTGTIATAGYATYAFTPDEIDQKTKAFRESAYHDDVENDASTFDKIQGLIRSAAMTAPAKAVDVYLNLRRTIEEQVRDYTEPDSEKLLPDLHPLEKNMPTLVLDLNETLVYSDWKRDRGWRTFKRPGVIHFLEHLAPFYEIVVYSDQPNMYVDPVIERLDEKHCVRFKLSRSATKYEKGKHYRDLTKLNRDPAKVIYVSSHALENCLQPENSVPVKPWKPEDMDDTALLDLIPFLEYVARHRPSDIRPVLASYDRNSIAKEFIERSKEHQRRLQEQKQQGRMWRR